MLSLESPVMDKGTNMATSDYKNVQFSQEQLAFLEEHFQLTQFGPTASEAQLRHYHGNQMVLSLVRSKTRGNTTRQVGGDIPSPR